MHKRSKRSLKERIRRRYDGALQKTGLVGFLFSDRFPVGLSILIGYDAVVCRVVAHRIETMHLCALIASTRPILIWYTRLFGCVILIQGRTQKDMGRIKKGK